MNARVVVLAFDDYKYVPQAKAITQANRSKNKAVYQVNEREGLETLMPLDYNTRLSNRVYKRKVIDLIAETLVDHVDLQLGQALIIDYVECPVMFQLDPETRKPKAKCLVDIPPLGECDIKFTRWSRHFGDLIAHSVDGDFIPIALMEYEKQHLAALEGLDKQNCGGGVGHGSRRSDSGRPLPNIKTPANLAIFRLEYGAAERLLQAASLAPASRKSPPRDADDGSGCLPNKKKRGSSNTRQGPASGAPGQAPSPAAPPASSPHSAQQPYVRTGQGKHMEYVNIPLLYEGMKAAMRQFEGQGVLRQLWSKADAEGSGLEGNSCNGLESRDARRNYMRIFASMIALTGTDFSRGLPLLGPGKIWDMMPFRGIWSFLAESYDAATNSINVQQAAEGFVAALYTEKYSNHARMYAQHQPGAPLLTPH